MGKKVKEYKSGDFIFAKVKGYPAWPARVQKLNGKKYFVYFYGTGETANLPPTMIFDYAENKDKFLTKMVKRRDFNDGVKQIEHDFANNVPLEQVIGVAVEPSNETANDSAIDTTLNDTMDDTAAETDAADDTVNTTQNDTAVEDSDETGALVIDEGKQTPKGRKSKAEPKTSAKETPKVQAKTPRGKAKKDDKPEEKDDEKKDEEIVSRSGRKIRPKRYIDEHTDENATLPSPAPKKKRAASPEKEKEKEKNIKHFNAVTQSELEDLKEPFKPEDPEKGNILIAYLPSGQYVGVKVFTNRPANFKNESTRLQWDKQAASNGITLKLQLERGQITPQSVQAQLVMDLNLTDEEKATLDKERETEEKRSRVQFLKTEMKLIELDAKIKTCLCLEKADTDLCLKLLDELMELDVKPLMLLKHPTCLETVKRMRAYVGNTPSWDLSETEALLFSKQAHRIRKQADTLYRNLKELFVTPDGLSFWEFFSEKVLQFKKATAKLNPNELLEMVHEPIEMSQPCAVTMKAAIEAAKQQEHPVDDDGAKKKTTSSKTKKAPATPKGKRTKKQAEPVEEDKSEENNEEAAKEDQTDAAEKTADTNNEEAPPNDTPKDTPMETESETDKPTESTEQNKETSETPQENNSKDDKESNDIDKSSEEKKSDKEKEKNSEDKKSNKEKSSEEKKSSEDKKSNKEKSSEEKKSDKEKSSEEKKSEKEGDKEDKDKQETSEPRAKRARESKKTEPPPPRSPAKRKSKA